MMGVGMREGDGRIGWVERDRTLSGDTGTVDEQLDGDDGEVGGAHPLMLASPRTSRASTTPQVRKQTLADVANTVLRAQCREHGFVELSVDLRPYGPPG